MRIVLRCSTTNTSLLSPGRAVTSTGRSNVPTTVATTVATREPVTGGGGSGGAGGAGVSHDEADAGSRRDRLARASERELARLDAHGDGRFGSSADGSRAEGEGHRGNEGDEREVRERDAHGARVRSGCGGAVEPFQNP
jgi:hypothetical protein